MPQLAYLDRPLGRWLAIFFRDCVATEVTLILATTDQATVEAGHASPAGRSPFSLLATTSRAFHSGADLQLGILRDVIIISDIVERPLDLFVHRLAAELRYYHRIPVVVKSPSIFHASIVPVTAVDCKASARRISTAV